LCGGSAKWTPREQTHMRRAAARRPGPRPGPRPAGGPTVLALTHLLLPAVPPRAATATAREENGHTEKSNEPFFVVPFPSLRAATEMATGRIFRPKAKTGFAAPEALHRKKVLPVPGAVGREAQAYPPALGIVALRAGIHMALASTRPTRGSFEGISEGGGAHATLERVASQISSAVLGKIFVSHPRVGRMPRFLFASAKFVSPPTPPTFPALTF
jgi:hypothetical protein